MATDMVSVAQIMEEGCRKYRIIFHSASTGIFSLLQAVRNRSWACIDSPPHGMKLGAVSRWISQSKSWQIGPNPRGMGLTLSARQSWKIPTNGQAGAGYDIEELKKRLLAILPPLRRVVLRSIVLLEMRNAPNSSIS
jgi:hypothetical protein